MHHQQMSASQSTPSEQAQKLLKGTLSLDYPAKGCSASRTRGQLCGACLRLETIDTKLSAVVEEVERLLLIRTEVKERLNEHHDPFTQLLPIEITSKIFSIYTENFNSDFDPQNPTIEYGGPLLLGAVSKSWREITLATPHLWNTVNILIPSTDKLLTKVDLTKLWLDRSRQLPLHLTLINGRSSSTDPDRVKLESDSWIPLFNVLQSVAPRWYTLVIGISVLYATFFGEITCAPALNTLKLVFGLSKVYNRRRKILLPHMPSLKHLDSQMDFHPSNISIDWGNLTTFKAYGISLDGLFELLRLAEGLESLTLDSLTTSSREYPITPLTHSALKRLNLGPSDDSAINPLGLEVLFDLVVFPSLEQFGYRSSRSYFFPNRSIQAQFERSHCQLTHFSLSGDFEEGTPDNLISILSDLPTITHLNLEDSYIRPREEVIMSDELLQILAPIRHGEFAHSGRLLPHLESLEFRGYKSFSWSCLASLVSATTMDGGPHLRTISAGQGFSSSIRRISFRVYFRGERELIDARSLAQFQCARDAGVSIVIVNEAHPGPPKPSFDNDTADCVYPFDLFPSPTIDR